MLNKRDLVVALEKKLDDAKDFRDKLQSLLVFGGMVEKYFHHARGVVCGLESAIVSVKGMEESVRKFYVNKYGFKDDTAYVERIGLYSKVCVDVDGTVSEVSAWDDMLCKFVDDGDWIEVTEEKAKKLRTMAQLAKSKVSP